MRLKVAALLIGLFIIPGIAYSSPIQWASSSGGNDHWYELINVSINWDDAKAAAEAKTHDSKPGHLATVTSSAENMWITTTFGGSNLHLRWLGGYQVPGSPEPAGGWTWVTGEDWVYDNWWPGHPNNNPSGENALIFDHGIYNGSYAWNDLTNTWVRNGYLVEYETPIPEPTTMLLLGFGLIGLAGARRKLS